MANNLKGLTIEIGGDTTKLDKALQDVNKKSRSLSSELGEINKLLKMDPGNTELLAQKQKVLADAISNTSKKLDTLKQAEKQVQEQFKRGEVSEEQVRALQREIVATEKKMDGYEKAAKETENALRGVGNESKNVAEHSGRMGEALKNAAAVGLTAVAAAAGAAVTALAGATVEAAAYADDMLTMSTVTGMTTDDLQAFSYAAGLLDVDVETISKSLAKNTKSMAGAADGSKAYADAYKKLGVNVTDANGNLRDGETVYWEAIDALGQMTNETERDAVAMQLFGKSAQELNPLIEAGSEKVNELKQEAKDVGAVMSGETLAALGSFDDSIQRLKGSAGAAKNSLGGVLLPELQMLTDSGTDLLGDFTQNLNASGGGLEGLVATVSGMSGQITTALVGVATQLLGSVATILPALVTVAVQLVTSLATSLISMLPQLVTTGIQIILALIQGVTQAIPQVVQAIVGMIPQLVNALVTGIPQMITGAVMLLLAIMEAIPLILPPLVAALPTIVNTIVSTLLANLPILLQAAVTLFLAIVQAIPQMLGSLAAELPTIVNTVMDGLSELPGKVFDIGCDLVKGLWDGIQSLAGWLWDQVSGWASGIWDGICGVFDINSPSRKMAWAGQMLDEGLAEGIDDYASAPTKAAQHMSSGVLDAANSGLAFERQLNRPKVSTSAVAAAGVANNSAILAALDGIYERLGHLQMVTDTGALVGEIVDKMDAALAGNQLLRARGV